MVFSPSLRLPGAPGLRDLGSFVENLRKPQVRCLRLAGAPGFRDLGSSVENLRKPQVHFLKLPGAI
ncbi:MAG: hypothetical protein ACREL1_02610 [bacterium]